MGVYPESFLAPMRADIAALDARLARAAPEGDSKLKVGEPKGQSANSLKHTKLGEGAH
jgi:NADH-quinone oxidoreductase subunit M